MQAPVVLSDSQMENEEAVYPCKGCGEVRIIFFGTQLERCTSLWMTADTNCALRRFSRRAKHSNSVRYIITHRARWDECRRVLASHCLISSDLRCPRLCIRPFDDPANTCAAGNRWHIDCFRCNTCGTLLDSDANLLLLGDGSLICNNCTYSCSACGNKIEDLAILTGDQAFCANCFKCRNCKRKIDNLRYARTSQGIFCMQCHESLMARRRKKGKGMPRTVSTNSTANGGPVVLDKSLPALPPHVLPSSTFPPPSDTATPQPHGNVDEQLITSNRKSSYPSIKREPSPRAVEGRKGKQR